MIAGLLADLVLVLHLVFILFVALGGLLALVWRRAPWLHVPAAVWGVAVEVTGGVCPLTPLENALRASAGEAGYPEGFIDHYVVPVVYPAVLARPDGLSRSVQWALAAVVVVLNMVVYWLVLRRSTRERARFSALR